MKIDLDEARRVAALASLDFRPAELEKVAFEMSRILDWVDQLDAIDLLAVPDQSDVSSPVSRADEARRPDLATDLEENAPSMMHGHFVVPRVIGGG